MSRGRLLFIHAFLSWSPFNSKSEKTNSCRSNLCGTHGKLQYFADRGSRRCWSTHAQGVGGEGAGGNCSVYDGCARAYRLEIWSVRTRAFSVLHLPLSQIGVCLCAEQQLDQHKGASHTHRVVRGEELKIAQTNIQCVESGSRQGGRWWVAEELASATRVEGGERGQPPAAGRRRVEITCMCMYARAGGMHATCDTFPNGQSHSEHLLATHKHYYMEQATLFTRGIIQTAAVAQPTQLFPLFLLRTRGRPIASSVCAMIPTIHHGENLKKMRPSTAARTRLSKVRHRLEDERGGYAQSNLPQSPTDIVRLVGEKLRIQS